MEKIIYNRKIKKVLIILIVIMLLSSYILPLKSYAIDEGDETLLLKWLLSQNSEISEDVYKSVLRELKGNYTIQKDTNTGGIIGVTTTLDCDSFFQIVIPEIIAVYMGRMD